MRDTESWDVDWKDQLELSFKQLSPTYIFILLGLQRSKGGVLEDGFGFDDWSGSSGAREGGVREHVWRLARRESQGGALEVWRFLLLVNGLRERSRLTAVTVQPDLVFGVLGEGVVYGEVRLVLRVIVRVVQSIVWSKCKDLNFMSNSGQ